MDNITTQVFWEKNGLVNRNPNINDNQVFSRCPTKDFPYDAVSVRINNQSKGTATVYFKDAVKTRTYGSGNHQQSYDYCDSEIKVTLPVKSNWNGEDYNYSMQGTIPKKYDLITFARILQYVRDELEAMSGASYNIPHSRVAEKMHI